MSKKLKYGVGTATIEIEGAEKAMFLAALRSANKALMDVLEKELAELEKNAQDNWPTRQKKYGQSQNSRNAFATELRFQPPSTIVGSVSNTAQYAWAIRAGADSTTNVKKGKRVADVLLWQPARKQAQKLAQEIAIKTVKRIK